MTVFERLVLKALRLLVSRAYIDSAARLHHRDKHGTLNTWQTEAESFIVEARRATE